MTYMEQMVGASIIAPVPSIILAVVTVLLGALMNSYYAVMAQERERRERILRESPVAYLWLVQQEFGKGNNS